MAVSNVGQHATLTTVDGKIYRGILYSVDENVGKIVLKNVSIDNTKLPGLHNFYASNVKELDLTQGLQLQELDLLDKDSTKTRKGRKQVRDRKDRPRHLNRLLRFNSDDLIRSPCNCSGYESGDQGIGSSAEESEAFEDYYERDNFIMFCRTCEKFRDSIVHLMKQDHIALTFFGVDMSRNGVLSLIQVATEETIFMYDILRLGVEGFVDGLQAVLESNTVTKIIHDCRMVSDVLYHQYKVTLSNVFDTQVAGVFVMRYNNGGDWPRFVDSLPVALRTHLGLKNEDVHQFFVREKLKQRDEEVWLQRPLCNKLLRDTLKNLVHIFPLFHTLQAKMMMEFTIGVQLYLNHVRDAPQDNVDKFGSLSYLLPFVFQDLPQLAAHSTRQTTPHRRSKTSFDSNGFVDVCQTKCCPSVTTSRDSIWHSSKDFLPVSKCETNNVETGLKPAQISSLVSNFKTLSPPSFESSATSSCQPQDKHVSSTASNNNTKFSPFESAQSMTEKASFESSSTSSCQPQDKHVFSKSSNNNTKFSQFLSMTEKASTAKSETHSGIERSALFRLSPPSCFSTSSNCSEILSDPEIVDVGLRTENDPSIQGDWDVDKVLEFEMAQRILKYARQGYSKSETKRRLLPSKVKLSPKPGSGC